MTGKFILKKGPILFEFPNAELANIDETADGIAFTLKSGFHIRVEDAWMDSTMKATIMSAKNYTKGTITIDFANRKAPISVNLT